MPMRSRFAAATATLAVAGAGLLGLAAPASADSLGLICPSRAEYIDGSGGHKGARISCTGGSFFLAIRCEKQDSSRYRYWHFGNWASSGGTSTVWCDLNAKIIETETRTS